MLAILAAVLMQAAPAAAPAPRPSVIIQPDWVKKPTGQDVSDLYPKAAAAARIEGHATLHCHVAATGELVDCTILGEGPPDQGFGDAALAMAAKFRMRPQSKDGVPVAGGQVSIPIRFVLPQIADPELIAQPQWAKSPGQLWGSHFYPKALADDGRGGRGVVLCRAGPKGELLDCQLRSEDPAGLGIAKAMIDIAPEYRLKPVAADGRPVAGRPVVLAITFRPPIVAVHADRGWTILQDPYTWDWAYPKAALEAKVGGEAVIECKGERGKKSATCALVSESPMGQGFGEAALKVRAQILLKPPPGGVDPNDRTLRLTVTFRPTPPPKRFG